MGQQVNIRCVYARDRIIKTITCLLFLDKPIIK